MLLVFCSFSIFISLDNIRRFHCHVLPRFVLLAVYRPLIVLVPFAHRRRQTGEFPQFCYGHPRVTLPLLLFLEG